MNKQQKDALIARAIAQKGKPQEAKFEQRLLDLALELYDEAIPQPPSLDPAWILFKGTINIGHEGFESSYYVQRSPSKYHRLRDQQLKLGVSRPFPLEYRNERTIEPSKALAKKFDKFIKDLNAFIDSQDQLRRDMNALLATVRTYKQLTVAWPEGVKLYEDFQPVSASRALVDPSVLTRLNKELL